MIIRILRRVLEKVSRVGIIVVYHQRMLQPMPFVKKYSVTDYAVHSVLVRIFTVPTKFDSIYVMSEPNYGKKFRLEEHNSKERITAGPISKDRASEEVWMIVLYRPEMELIRIITIDTT